MEFNFDCVQSLGCDENGIAILEGSYQNRIVPGYILFVKEILNSMGEASSRAQQLNTIITSAHKFFISNHRIFIKAEQNKVLGFLKVGSKKLFLRDRNYNYHEVNALCVLDFYVYETVQRRGIGKELFDYMLKFEKKIPTELAYDKPSPKLLSFLKKYFGLCDFIQQSNNYMVFDEFFSLIPTSKNNITYDNDTNRAIKNLTNLSDNQNFFDKNNYENMNNINNNNYRNENNYDNRNNMNSYRNENNYENMNNNNMANMNNINNENNLRYNNNMNNINSENNLRYNNNPNNPSNIPPDNDFNQNFARTSPPSQNYNGNNFPNNNNNNDNFRTSMSSVGEKLIYNNSFSNNVVNKDVYKHPTIGFQNYYLNNPESNAYDNIYSKQKINLINDYLSSKKQSEDEFISEQLGIKENSINNSNSRLNELTNKISDIRLENRFNKDYLYNKRNQYATLFDDKKLVEYNYKQNLNRNINNSITEKDFQNYQMNRVINGKKSPQRLQHYTPFSNLGKVYTTVLPTSSQAYGAYFKNDEFNRKEQSPNRLYY